MLIFRSVLPAITKKFVPTGIALRIFDELFALTFGLLKQGLYKDSPSTQELLFTSMIDFAQTETTMA